MGTSLTSTESLARVARRTEPSRIHLSIAPDGRWFRWADGATIDLSRRRSLQQVLAALSGHRERAPGEPVTSMELIARGWPGEQIAFESARNRLYVAMNALRELGLRGAIAKSSTGYLIPATLRVDRG